MYFQLNVFPASTLVLVWHIQFLSKQLKSHDSLVSYLGGARKLHQFLQVPTNGFSGFFTENNLGRSEEN